MASGDLYREFDRKYFRSDRVSGIFFIPVKPLICRMIFKSRLGSEHSKIKTSETTEKQQHQRALSITERRKCERERRTGSDKNKIVERR